MCAIVYASDIGGGAPIIMKAIVLAAGFGKRIGAATVDRPKCMLRLGGQTILAHQAQAFRAVGVEDIVVVVGHGADAVRLEGARFVHNAEYATTNILGSLLCAIEELNGPCVITYGDIVFAQSVVSQLVARKDEDDFVLVVDRDWARVYQGRIEHPVEQAELTVVRDGAIVRLGKCVGPAGAHGEYIGLMKLSAAGAGTLQKAARAVQAAYQGRENEAFANAPRFRDAYLCDLLQHMADGGARLVPLDIFGKWREIDTVFDYERAAAEIDWL